jgi:hypothetical protein
MPKLSRFTVIGSAILGIATLVLGIIMLFVFPHKAELSAGFRTPIIAFEFAKTDADLAFLSGDSQISRLNRTRMDAGHRWDMAFPFAYAGFIAFLMSQIVARGRYWLGLAIPVALLIIPFDLRENTILLAITDALGSSASIELLLQELHIATWLKWGALGISVAALALGYLAEKAYLASVFSTIAALGVALCWVSGSKPVVAEAMSLALFLFFIYFSLVSCMQAWKLFSSNKETHVSDH